jgi:hypothetical protein
MLESPRDIRRDEPRGFDGDVDSRSIRKGCNPFPDSGMKVEALWLQAKVCSDTEGDVIDGKLADAPGCVGAGKEEQVMEAGEMPGP